MKIRLSALVLIALTLVGVRSTAAQTTRDVVVPRPLVVIARRDLSFGTVLPGIPSTVLISDVRHSGLFEIQGHKYGVVRVELVLPTALRSIGGAELPLAFGPGDGAAATDRGRFHGAVFDPREPITATLGTSGKLYVHLGGTVLPFRHQPGGAYQATIYLTVYDLGS
jgi:hypothetical protein